MPAQILTNAACFPPAHRQKSLLSRLATAFAVGHQRRALAQLDDVRLADLGLTREQAEAESARPFWNAPHHWR